MTLSERAIAAIGDEPPLAGGRAGPPDRRQVSARWLTGAVLTGITSSLLMGVALFAALNGREQLATPPEVVSSESQQRPAAGAPAKADRLAPPRQVARATDRERMEVSTMLRDGDRNVVRTLPFVRVKMALAQGHAAARDYPSFDPLAVFAEKGAAQQAAVAYTGLIYGAKVESEVSLRTVDFPVDTATFEEAGDLSAAEVEEVVRNTAAILTEGDVRVASLHYVDPSRFGLAGLTPASIASAYAARVVEENVSVFRRNRQAAPEREFAEDVIPFASDKTIAAALTDAGYTGGDATSMAQAFAKVLTDRPLKAGTVLRLGIEMKGENYSRIVRASIYDEDRHVKTISLTDRNQLMVGDAPEPSGAVSAAFDETPPPVRARAELPTAYDGIWRAAMSYGLSDDMIGQLVRLLAADVDFQARLNPADRLDIFFSSPDEKDQATPDSEMLYIKASFGGNMRTFYRFQMEDGTVDYFDSEGRSARQFLLRNPVPNGRFNNGFGMRRHPILGYSRMHTGVDWTAPRGTPIIATGSGTVEHAGWESGYGRQTRIRHANGYISSYSHQSAIANGVVEGARVRQGQVIGYVGATGLATGNHLHYELIVNGTKVDPMRVRLPNSRALKDEELVAFTSERDRIDELLAEDDQGQLKLANVVNK